MGQRNAGRGGTAQRRGDAWHDGNRQARVAQRLDLLATPAEHERIARFQPHHGLAGAHAAHQFGIDVGLRPACTVFAFADRHQLGVAARARQDGRRHEIVVQDGVGLLQELSGAQGQEVGIARAGTDDMGDAGGRHVTTGGIELAQGKSSPEYIRARAAADASESRLHERIDAIQKEIALIDAENPAVRDAGAAAYGAHESLHRLGPPTSIEIHGAREHNLKNVDVNLGLNQFTVITGVSGSGKSTLAFDILFAEGQRRYLESLNAYARQFVQPASRPDVDAIFGIPPTVAIEQRTSRGGHKSTVATLTEIYHFLRLLYVKLGVQYCPVCEARIEPQSADAIAARLLKDYRGKSVTLLAPLIVARKGLYTALAKWARGKGFAHLKVDGTLLPTAKWPRLDRFIEHNIELPVATLTLSAAREAELRRVNLRDFRLGQDAVRPRIAQQLERAVEARLEA